MKIKTFLLFLMMTFPCTVFAHTGGMVDFTCPIDGTTFRAYQEFSSYTSGARLDLKRVGAVEQPWLLPECPKCHFVIFDEQNSTKNADLLRSFILSDEYQKYAPKSSYYRLAIIQEYLKSPSFDSAWSYLYASWQNEAVSDEYKNCLEKALDAFRKASADLSSNPEKHDDYLISCYLQIEISRRLERFDEASKAISAFPVIGKTKIEWLSDVLKFQKQLIDAKDASGKHQIADAMPKK